MKEIYEKVWIKSEDISANEILKGCEHDGSYIPVSEVKRLLNLCIEQYKSQPIEPVEQLTDGEIEQWVEKRYFDYSYNWKQAFINGCKWYRDQQQIKLRDELIKFLDFADPIYWGENEICDRRELIDIYLSKTPDVNLDYQREDGK